MQSIVGRQRWSVRGSARSAAASALIPAGQTDRYNRLLGPPGCRASDRSDICGQIAPTRYFEAPQGDRRHERGAALDIAVNVARRKRVLRRFLTTGQADDVS